MSPCLRTRLIVFAEVFHGVFGVGNDRGASFLPSGGADLSVGVGVLECLHESKKKNF